MINKKQNNWLKKRCWVEINLDKLTHNVKVIKNHLSKNAMLLAVVKADAYGHGESVVAPELASMPEVDWLGVSELEEGLSVREKEISKPVLVFTPPLAEYADIIAGNNLTITISGLEYANNLNDYAKKQNVIVEAHLKLDTGMNRLGIKVENQLLDENLEEILEIYGLSNVKITGIYTHFATADCLEPELSQFREYQHKNFVRALDKLESLNVKLGIRHCANSGAIVCDKSYHLDMVRAGIILYGNSPGSRCEGILQLESTMEMFTRITHVKDIAAGEKIGYGCTYTTEKPTKVATIGFGYADGYPRLMSNKAKMIVNGQIANNIGRLCMDQMMLDISGIPAKVGDIVTVIGKSGGKEISWDWLAKSVGTINYEMMCLVGKRVFRVYIKDNEITEGFSYMKK